MERIIDSTKTIVESVKQFITEKQRTPEARKALKFVDFGIELIKEGKYNEAIKHLKDKKTASILGVNIENARSVLPEVDSNGNIIDKSTVIYMQAKESMFKRYDTGHITSSPRRGTSTVNVGSIQIATVSRFQDLRNEGGGIEFIPYPDEEIQHNVALVAAEEWLHAVGCLNNDKALAGQVDPEIDAAQYLYNQGVSLTPDFLGRYDRDALIIRNDQ